MARMTIKEAEEFMFNQRKNRHKGFLISHGVNHEGTIQLIKKDFLKNMPYAKMTFGEYLNILKSDILQKK